MTTISTSHPQNIDDTFTLNNPEFTTDYCFAI